MTDLTAGKRLRSTGIVIDVTFSEDRGVFGVGWTWGAAPCGICGDHRMSATAQLHRSIRQAYDDDLGLTYNVSGSSG